jgi:prepilin-type N-terminal cleavage/methylation domain-containing protein
MKRCPRQFGFTLVELLVVAAIIMILAAALLGVGRRILIHAQEKLARSTMDILVTAIEQYRSELDRFPMEYLNSQPMPVLSAPIKDLSGKVIKPAFGQADLIAYLNDDLGLNRMTPAQTVTILPTGSVCDDYAVSECLYYFLRQAPASRRILDTIADSQKTALDANRNPRQAVYKDTTGKETTITLIRLIDPWGSPFRYEYGRPTAAFPNVQAVSFPRITSAGPDRKFDTADDLRSDE